MATKDVVDEIMNSYRNEQLFGSGVQARIISVQVGYIPAPLSVFAGEFGCESGPNT
jgi:hypothetical protein